MTMSVGSGGSGGRTAAGSDAGAMRGIGEPTNSVAQTFERASLTVPQAQDVRDQVIHVVGVNDEVRHGRVHRA